MVLVLDHDECIASHDLVGDVPRCSGRAGPSAHFETRSLTQRVQRESAVLADNPAVGSFDGSRFGAQVSTQEFLEWAFADEADAGAVRLVEHRQSRGVSNAAYL